MVEPSCSSGTADKHLPKIGYSEFSRRSRRTLQKIPGHLSILFPKGWADGSLILWHWDMHAPNFFVKDDRITSLIDWQSMWADPLFFQYRYPKLVHYTGDAILRLPEHYNLRTTRTWKRAKRSGRKSSWEISCAISIWDRNQETESFAYRNQWYPSGHDKKTNDQIRWGHLGRRYFTLQAVSYQIRKVCPTFLSISRNRLTKNIKALGWNGFWCSLPYPFYRGRYTESYVRRRGMERAGRFLGWFRRVCCPRWVDLEWDIQRSPRDVYWTPGAGTEENDWWGEEGFWEADQVG